MTGHNTNEGLFFTAETIKTAQDIKDALRDALPSLSNSSIDSALDEYYPVSQFQDVTQQVRELIRSHVTFSIESRRLGSDSCMRSG